MSRRESNGTTMNAMPSGDADTPLAGLRAFLSYATEDTRHAKDLRGLLESLGAKIWYDKRDILIGHTIEHQLRDAIKASHAAIALLSRASIRSTWVMFELGACWYASRPIFPVGIGLAPEESPQFLHNRVACDIDEIEDRLLPSLTKLAASLESHSIAHPLDLERIASRALLAAGCRGTPREFQITNVLADCLSAKLHTRRRAHRVVRRAPSKVRATFLSAVRELLDCQDDRIRGEAYYCLGSITGPDGSLTEGEQFFSDGLESDDSLWVKANCAQVLEFFTPLSATTIDRLNKCKSYAPDADGDERSELMFRIYSTLYRHYEKCSENKNDSGPRR